MSVTIYHNPKCATSRHVLALIKEKGIEPTVIEYLKNPPSRETLEALIQQMGGSPRAILRAKQKKLYDELGLGDTSLSDSALVDAMMENPVLIDRPIVVTDKAARLCRPKDLVLEML